jgi:polyphosphate kinase 2 (PPK2 family)
MAQRSGTKATKQSSKRDSGDGRVAEPTQRTQQQKMSRKDYNRELAKLQIELVKLQEWIRHAGLKVVVLFEGRDAAGKGGTIKRITESLNPRICRVVALGTPTERERSQWYFQRYAAQLPAAGEMVLFDRSWYNRAGVERVMGFCTEEEVQEFFRSCPQFEGMLIRSGIQRRIDDPTRRWKLSPMDLKSRERWLDYSRAKDDMFAHTDTKDSPWWVVDADVKRHARLNCISHLLSMIPYQDLTPEPITLPPRRDHGKYVRPPISEQTFVPARYP